jgi:DNA ligase (NAD+)
LNKQILERLKSHGLQLSLSEEMMRPKGDSLSGQTIVISGTFSKHSRDEYKKMIEQHGGKNSGSISGKTSFVLAGENMGPEKMKRAEKLGIRMLNEDDFLKIITSTPQK